MSAAPILAVADGGELEARTTWAAVDLAAVIAGEHAEPAPTMLVRTDGRCLIYERRLHAVQGEPESLKGWLAIEACAQQLAIGKAALYIDYEDSAASIVQRLRELGVSDETIAAHLTYVRPDEPLADAAIQDLEAALAREPVLAVIDGLTEAFSRQGLSPLDNVDVAIWLDVLPRRLVRAGCAVLMLDHVVKDREQRGRWALGAQHKLAGVDVAYSVRVLEPFAPGREGLVAIKVEKDRPGRVREFSPDGQAALLRASSRPDGVTITLEPPEPGGADSGEFRPTNLMEKVSRLLADEPGATRNAVRRGVRGKGEYIDLALRLLVSERFVERRQEGQGQRHYNLIPYHERDEPGPESQPSPERVPDPATPTESPGPSSYREDPDPGLGPRAANRARVLCKCADGGEPSETFPGRCDRCYGQREETGA